MMIKIENESQLNFFKEKKTIVSVFQKEELIGEGAIEEYNKNTIKINGDNYIRKSCEFYIKINLPQEN